MASKSPGFTYYPKDLLVDTATMSPEEVGVYWLLVSFAWVGLPGTGGQCCLPDDDRQLAMLARLPLKEWQAMRERILALFQRDAATGHLVHGRLLKELRSQQTRSKTGKKNVGKRWGNDTNDGSEPVPGSLPTAYQTTSTSYGSGSTHAGALKADANEDANEDVTQDPGEGVRGGGPPAGAESHRPPVQAWPPPADPAEAAIGADFDAFWAAYPAPLNQPDAERAWLETAPERPPLPELLLALKALAASARWRAEGGRAIPGPGKWLRRRGWTERPPARGDGYNPQTDLMAPTEVELRFAAEGHPAFAHLRHLLPAGDAS